MNVLHQGADIPISSIDAAMNVTNLKTISNVQIPACSIAMLLTKLAGKCITAIPCILEVEIDEIVSVHSLQLTMLPMVHLKEEIEPAQVPLTIIDISHDAI